MKTGITMLIHNKDDIKFVSEFPCFLGHSVQISHFPSIYKKAYFLNSLLFLQDLIFLISFLNFTNNTGHLIESNFFQNDEQT